MELKNTEYEVDAKGIAIIWLNRPQRMNAWTGRLHTEYRYLLQQANDDDAVRAIVVTGRGKGFCVGLAVKFEKWAIPPEVNGISLQLLLTEGAEPILLL